jgi:SAM-dependent methyltransferase
MTNFSATIPRIFDSRAYAMRRTRAARRGQHSFLETDVAENFSERLSAVKRRFTDALDLSSRESAFQFIQRHAARWTQTTVVAEESALVFATGTFDLVTSVLSLHAVNDLPGALAEIRRVLKPDGLFLAALFGGGTLGELRRALAFGESETIGGVSPRVAPFADVRDLGGLLQRAGFALPVADVERIDVAYSEFRTLVTDLRALGETNALAERSRKFLRRDTLAAALAQYSAADADETGRLRATFDVIYLTAWAPHESQQKPLAPGSAKTRLADPLGTKEKSAGEPAPISKKP